MQVEIFSDVVCPWCYIGKRHMEQALAQFAQADGVTVTYRSFQLDPTTPKNGSDTALERLARKYGVSLAEATAMNNRVSDVAATAGLEFHLEKAHPANTIDAHRLLHFAAQHDKQEPLKERLLRAYFTEGERVDDAETLVRCATEVGLDGNEAQAVVESDAYQSDFDADLSLAKSFGVSSVPFFVIDRKYGISGAQPAAVILQTLEKAWLEANPLRLVTSDNITPDSDGSGQTGKAHEGGGNGDSAAACVDGSCEA